MNPQIPTTENSSTETVKRSSCNYFMQHGSHFFVKNRLDAVAHNELPGGNYVIRITPQGEFYLEKIEDFPTLGKVYGKATAHAERILKSFSTKNKNLGVMLAGLKGSGKTLLTRAISLGAAKDNIPTILISSPFTGDKFYQFLSSIEQPTVVLIDEFEKIYDAEDQQELLTLLDGVYQSKKLFLLTCNDKWKVDSHFRNRPGRIHYMIEFEGLDNQFIEEYCQDNLKDKSKLEEVVGVCSLFNSMNFDMLQALVWEMNTYDEPAIRAIELLNVKPDSDSNAEFQFRVITESGEILEKSDIIHSPIIAGNPVNMKPTLFRFKNKKDYAQILAQVKKQFIKDNYAGEANPVLTDDDSEYIEDDAKARCAINLIISPEDLVSTAPKEGKFLFEKEGYKIEVTRVTHRNKSFEERYSSLF